MPFPKRPNAAMANRRLDFVEWDHFLRQFVHELVQQADRALGPIAREGPLPASSSDTDERTRSVAVSSASSSRFRDGSPSEIATSADVSITISPESESIVAEDLFRRTGVENWKRADPGAESVHFGSVRGRSVLRSVSSRAAITASLSVTPIPLADLLSQTMGDRDS